MTRKKLNSALVEREREGGKFDTPHPSYSYLSEYQTSLKLSAFCPMKFWKLPHGVPLTDDIFFPNVQNNCAPLYIKQKKEKKQRSSKDLPYRGQKHAYKYRSIRRSKTNYSILPSALPKVHQNERDLLHQLLSIFFFHDRVTFTIKDAIFPIYTSRCD